MLSGNVLVFGSVLYFLVAYFVYGGFLERIFGIDGKRPCPSVSENDGIDYVPTAEPVLFGHHFASIAGAGPIVGPVLAARYGWGCALMWIIIGCVFIGAMHDFAAMFLSVRNRGRSVAYVIEDELGYAGRQLFLLFCLACLVLVVTVFTSMVASSFVSTPAVATASVLFIVIAPFFGVATGRKILPLLEGSLVFVPLLFLCIWLGTVIPFDLARILGSAEAATRVWIVALLYYAFCASVIPVWVLLQPRDYLNSYLLYAMMLLGFAGVFASRPALHLPAFNFTSSEAVPEVVPLLFVTIACGACSGFHALVASGTSAKQVASERHIRPIAYGGMLVEGILAVLALCSVCYLDPQQFGVVREQPAPVQFASGLAHFCESLHIPFEAGRNFIALAISAFILTSLDTATRLARFVWQELMLPQGDQARPVAETEAGTRVGGVRAVLGNRWTATVVIVVAAGLLSFSGSGKHIWPVFGASNQLLAALTLLAVTLYLFRNRKPYLFALFPMLFMFLISIWALVILFRQHLHDNLALVVISAALLVLAFLLSYLSIRKVRELKGRLGARREA